MAKHKNPSRTRGGLQYRLDRVKVFFRGFFYGVVSEVFVIVCTETEQVVYRNCARLHRNWTWGCTETEHPPCGRLNPQRFFLRPVLRHRPE
jgi:hypothetical protein